MPVDKFGRGPPQTGCHCQPGVSVTYMNTNFLRQNENINMNGHIIKGLPVNVNPEHADQAVSWGQATSLVSSVAQTVVHKAGDTMNGNLNMGNNKITNVVEPQNDGDVSTKSYVDRTIVESLTNPIMQSKPLITLWAEEKGQINNDQYEWSWGDGAQHQRIGYTMMLSGRVLAMGVVCNSPSADFRVNIAVNGVENTSYRIRKQPRQHSHHITFDTPLELNAGDVINFRTDSRNVRASTVVSLLIELDRV